MLPVIALVGRPNVGKSTLFNRLTKTRDALVAGVPGLTRDRQFGKAQLDGRSFWLIDTGGLSGEEQGIDEHTLEDFLRAADAAARALEKINNQPGAHIEIVTNAGQGWIDHCLDFLDGMAFLKRLRKAALPHGTALVPPFSHYNSPENVQSFKDSFLIRFVLFNVRLLEL